MNDLIFQTLAGDGELCGLLGRICAADKTPTEIPAVFYGFSNTWDIIPAVSYFLMECSDARYADDECIMSKMVYQFDIYADNGTIDAVVDVTDRLLRDIGFYRRSVSEVLVTDGRHKKCIYYTYKEL